ncbi:MAG: GDP-mannose 4,6-dehydratase [candidate division Zixibacteria bacterium]|nr:GDP-mannose 4,6-dehydratase [candidate division Zixibacteria bacterium]
MTKIVVTGGAGFIGSNLAERLIETGREVVVVDDLSYGSLTNLKSVINNDNFTFIKGDICQPEVLEKAGADANCIIHLAAYKIPRYGNALKTLNVNNDGAKAVFNYGAKYNIKTIIASTSDVYGKNTNIPFNENDDLVLGAPSIRRWAYAISKAFDEQLALAYYNEKELPVVILRFFGSFGPHNHRSWWGGPQAVFIEQALKDKPITVHGDGCQTRSFCYVSDTVNGIILAMETKEAVGEVINVGSDHEICIKDLAQKIIALTNSKSQIEYIPYERFGGRYEDVRHRVPDLSKAYKLFGYKPTVSLDNGLKKTIDWQKSFYLN